MVESAFVSSYFPFLMHPARFIQGLAACSCLVGGRMLRSGGGEWYCSDLIG